MARLQETAVAKNILEQQNIKKNSKKNDKKSKKKKEQHGERDVRDNLHNSQAYPTTFRNIILNICL